MKQRPIARLQKTTAFSANRSTATLILILLLESRNPLCLEKSLSGCCLCVEAIIHSDEQGPEETASTATFSPRNKEYTSGEGASCRNRVGTSFSHDIETVERHRGKIQEMASNNGGIGDPSSSSVENEQHKNDLLYKKRYASKILGHSFDVKQSTEETYKSTAKVELESYSCEAAGKCESNDEIGNERNKVVRKCFDDVWHIFYGQFAEIRSTLDYTYHSNYAFERQRLQDEIISSMLHSASIVDVNGDTCTTPTEPWLVFTAGAMGAGKGHTIRNLVERKLLPLQGFVVVDPDEVRQFLPEYKIYIKENPMMAGELTRKEAGFICEILTQAALQSGKNVLVDGSLRDSDWYIQYFAQLRADYPVLRLAILHVTAPREAVLERAQKRGEMTGRKIPIATLEMAMDQVPKAVQHLSPLSDYFCELDNSPGAENVVITTPGVTNESFQENWLQMCLWVPGKPRATRSIEAVENILEQRRTLNRLSFSKRGSQILQQKISDMLKSVDFHLYDD